MLHCCDVSLGAAAAWPSSVSKSCNCKCGRSRQHGYGDFDLGMVTHCHTQCLKYLHAFIQSCESESCTGIVGLCEACVWDEAQLAAGSCALRLGLRRQMWPQLTGKARKVKRLPRAARSIAQLPRLLRHILRFSIILVEEFRKFLVRRLDFSVRPRQHTLACAKKLNRGKPTGTPK